MIRQTIVVRLHPKDKDKTYTLNGKDTFIFEDQDEETVRQWLKENAFDTDAYTLYWQYHRAWGYL
ncbi:MAG: hypothetical protein RBR24_05445 [Candidatus Carbobacillus sp.]|nr:hypothetical protein [Candidatus Carbobacillus sp.]